jgi:hypothetical protein
MNHLRNVIVHRRSLADRTFVNACPWLNSKIGERVRVNSETMKVYATMLSGYALDMVYRLTTRYGVPMPPREDPPSSPPPW